MPSGRMRGNRDPVRPCTTIEAQRPRTAVATDNGNRDVVLCDTTLRDGMQREGLSVSVDEKTRIAGRLAEMGIHVIEGGFPGSNPKDEEFFRRMADAAVGGWCAPGRIRNDAGERRGGGERPSAPRIGGQLGTRHHHRGQDLGSPRAQVLRVDREENLRMISESVGFCANRKGSDLRR